MFPAIENHLNFQSQIFIDGKMVLWQCGKWRHFRCWTAPHFHFCVLWSPASWIHCVFNN